MPSLAMIRSASGKSVSASTSVSNTSLTPSSSQRACRMLSSFLRPMPTKPWPPERMTRPLKCSSMSSQWLKACWIASAVAASQARMLSIVASENTTPQPKVSYGRLRSTTVMSWRGDSCFISSAKYRPAGPPPMQTMFKTDSREAK